MMTIQVWYKAWRDAVRSWKELAGSCCSPYSCLLLCTWLSTGTMHANQAFTGPSSACAGRLRAAGPAPLKGLCGTLRRHKYSVMGPRQLDAPQQAPASSWEMLQCRMHAADATNGYLAQTAMISSTGTPLVSGSSSQT